jgi:hypothetical protein
MGLSEYKVAAAVAVATVLTLLASSEALAYTPQGEWVYNPYPGDNPFYCDYYGSGYWCYAVNGVGDGQWFRAAPTWYDQNYAEIQRI